jgi:hypothetical protein
MGFIGYRQSVQDGTNTVRIYLECRDEAGGSLVTCGYSVDVVFSGSAPCRLRGVDGVLVMKKFYKLLFSLEERARERGNDWRGVMTSPERLLEHLRYTRNARDFTGASEPGVRPLSEVEEPECAA